MSTIARVSSIEDVRKERVADVVVSKKSCIVTFDPNLRGKRIKGY